MSSVFTADRTQVSAPNQLNNKCVLTALCMLSTAPSVVAEIKSEMYSLGASVVLPLWDPLDCSQGSSVPGNSFSRQEHWSGLPFPPLGDLPDPRLEPRFLASPALAGRFFTNNEAYQCHLGSLIISLRGKLKTGLG